MVVLYSKSEIEKIKEASQVVKEVFKQLKEYIKPGISTKDVDKLVEDIIYSMSAIPSSKGYYGFPGSCCTLVNNVVVHGIPDDKTILKEGDIISAIDGEDITDDEVSDVAGLIRNSDKDSMVSYMYFFSSFSSI